jgi:YVTN family beta-propeller protein
MDLSSTQASVAASGAGTIASGRHTLDVQTGQMLTPAQALALTQVLQTGQQSLVLSNLGNAVGGSVHLSASATESLSSLVIPRGVTVNGDFTNASAMNLSGNLQNHGTLNAYSNNPDFNAAALNANNIFNYRSGTISTGTNISDLLLNATQDIVNAGMISSSGNLSLVAGNSIVNSSGSSTAAILQAANNLTLVSNNITNTGLVNALAGNINLQTQNLNNMLVNNMGGTMQASAGSINVRDAAFSAKAHTDLMGGDWLSQSLNINSGTGIVKMNTGDITGQINVNAGEAHILADTANLNLGNINLSGDPTFFNTTGDVTISGSINFDGENLAIVAMRSILSTVASGTITTNSTTGNGGNITLVAGASFTSSGAQNVQPSGPGDTTSLLTIKGGSATGGKIDLTGITSVNSSSTVGSGGDVTMVAFAGKGTTAVAGGGKIIMPTTSTIDTSGASGQTNGDITIISSYPLSVPFDPTPENTSNNDINPDTAIILGTIDAAGAGAGLGGAVNIQSAAISAGKGITILDGAITSLTGFVAGSRLGGGVSLGNIQCDGNFFAATKGSYGPTDSVNTKTLVSGGTVQIFGRTVAVGGITAPNDVLVSAAGNMVTGGLIQSTAGNVTLITTANNGFINLGGNVQAFGTASLTTHGSGDILGVNKTVATISSSPAWQFLLGATINQNGTLIYVPDYGPFDDLNIIDNDSISVIDTSTNQQIIRVSGFNKPQGTVLSPDESKLYVANWGNSTISILNTSDNTLDPTPISIVSRPEAVAISPDGSRLYVLSDTDPATGPTAGLGGPATLTVIDTSDNTIITTVALGTNRFQTGGIAINPQGTLAYVSNSTSKNIFVVDLQSNTVSDTIDMSTLGSRMPFFLTMDQNGSRLYVSESFRAGATLSGSVAVIDVNPYSATFNTLLRDITNPPTDIFPQNAFPQGIAVNPTGTLVFTQNTYLNSITSILTFNNQVFETQIGTGQGPDGFGSSTFSTIVTNNGVPNIVTYTSNTINLTGPNTLSVVVQPTVQGANVNFKTTSGLIFVSYDTNGGTMTANANGLNGAVVLNNVGALPSTIGPSGAVTSLFEIGSVSPMTVAGPINAYNLVLHTNRNNAGITLNANVGSNFVGSTTSITTNGTGALLQTAGTVVATNVNLKSSLGDIGTSLAPIKTATSTLTAMAPDGSAYVSNSLALNLKGSGAGNTFQLTNAGHITVSEAVTALNTLLTTTKGNIVLGANVGGNEGFTNLNATGTISQTLNTTRVIGDTVYLTAKGNIGTALQAILTESTVPLELKALSPATVFVTNNLGVNLDPAVITGKGFTLNAGGDIVVNGAINTTITNLVATGTGKIILNGTAGKVGGTTTLNAGGGIDQGAGIVGPAVFGNTVNLISASGNIGGGTVGHLNTAATKLLTINSTISGDANVINTGNTILGASALNNGALSVSSSGNLTVNGIVTASAGVTAETTANNGNITINSQLGTAGTTTKLTTNGTGGINTAKLAVVNGAHIELASTAGSIGGKAPVNTAATVDIKANTGGLGTVSLNNTAVGGVALLQSSSGGAFTMKSTGNLLVSGSITTNAPLIGKTGNITLTQTGTGTLTVNADLTANGGNVIIQHIDPLAGNIEIGNDVTLTASSAATGVGNVTVVIGLIPKAPVPGTPPLTVTVNVTGTGKAFFGTNSITAGTNATVNVTNRNAVFSTGTAPTSAITLHDNVTVDASNVVIDYKSNQSAQNDGTEIIVDTGDMEDEAL